jgi:hypothetical protein
MTGAPVPEGADAIVMVEDSEEVNNTVRILGPARPGYIRKKAENLRVGQEALQKGIVNGIFSSLDILKDFNFAETCRYATICHMQTTSFGVIMNMDKWNSLPEDVKKVLDDLAREQSIWTGRYIDTHVRESVEWSREKYGVEIINLPENEYKLWHGMVKPLTGEWKKKASERGLPAAAFMKDLNTLKDKYEKEYGSM